VAPPGNQAANGENKYQPIVSGETGLLDSYFMNHYVPKNKAVKMKRDKVANGQRLKNRDIQQFI